MTTPTMRFLRSDRTLLLSTIFGLLSLAGGVLGLHQQLPERGPFPFLDPQATIAWELDDAGHPELVLKATARLAPGVSCDSSAVITRYWDTGGELVVATATDTQARPSGPSYSINLVRDGSAGEVRFRERDVPMNAVAYVTKLTAPIGACGPGGWWGERESVRLQIPPRPDIRR